MAPMLVITVADTGFGIEEKDLPKNFFTLLYGEEDKRPGIGSIHL